MPPPIPFFGGPEAIADIATAMKREVAFIDDLADLPKALRKESGKGRIVLCGPHPEGSEDWLENEDGTMVRDWEKWDARGSKYLAMDLFERLFSSRR